jgi:hypothetical protein
VGPVFSPRKNSTVSKIRHKPKSAARKRERWRKKAGRLEEKENENNNNNKNNNNKFNPLTSNEGKRGSKCIALLFL